MCRNWARFSEEMITIEGLFHWHNISDRRCEKLAGGQAPGGVWKQVWPFDSNSIQYPDRENEQTIWNVLLYTIPYFYRYHPLQVGFTALNNQASRA
jgi:hypothetical protein